MLKLRAEMDFINKTWLEAYLASLQYEQQRSSSTRLHYGIDLTQYLSTLKIKIPQVQEDQIREYLIKLQSQKLKRSTIARKLSAIRSFFDFLVREEVLTINPTNSIEFSNPSNQRLPKSLNQQEIQDLLQTVMTFPESEDLRKKALQSRDQLIFLLLYATGMRVSELVSLRIHQIDLENSYLRVVGKGHKERMIPFPSELSHQIIHFIELRRPHLDPKKKTSELILNARGNPLTRQGVWKLIQICCQKAGIQKKITPHMIRHTFATHLLESGMNLRSLQLLLGHSSLSTTQIYTELTPQHLKKIHRKYHPRGE